MQGYFLLAKHCVLFALLIAAVYTDIARGKIYNWCTFPAVFIGLMLSYAVGGLWDGGLRAENLGSSGLGAIFALGIFLWPYVKGGISAGDVKLITAVGAVGGFRNFYIIYALFFSALIGALMSVVVLLHRGKLWEGVKSSLSFMVSLKPRRAEEHSATGAYTGVTVPYGVAITLGSMLAWFLVELSG